MMIRACSPASASASCVRVLVDLHDDAVRVLELVDRVLQLAVEHHPVGDHDDLVEHLRRRPRRAGVESRCASQAIVFDLPDPAECCTR